MTHIIDGEFQSDKYPTCPPGKVPLSVKDRTAQDLLWEYAQRRRRVDAEFSNDLETVLKAAGYVPPKEVKITPEERRQWLSAGVLDLPDEAIPRLVQALEAVETERDQIIAAISELHGRRGTHGWKGDIDCIADRMCSWAVDLGESDSARQDAERRVTEAEERVADARRQALSEATEAISFLATGYRQTGAKVLQVAVARLRSLAGKAET